MVTTKRSCTQSLVPGAFPDGEPITALLSRAALSLRPARLWGAHRKRTAPSVKIVDALPESLVIPTLCGQSKDEVLRELAECMATCFADVDAGRLIDVLWERERLGSTAIHGGVAIPHGTLPGLQAPVRAAFGRHPRGVDFQSADGAPSKLVFLLVASAAPMGQHFKVLARVATLLKDEAARGRLLAAPNAAELYACVREEDGRR